MKRFIGYRPNPPAEYLEKGHANAPYEPQYQGVVFDDGTVVIRWMTKYKSHSVWASYDEFYQVHGHPEYGTVIWWLDEEYRKEEWEKEYHRVFNELLDTGNKLVKGYDDYEYWSIHDGLKAFIKELVKKYEPINPQPPLP